MRVFGNGVFAIRLLSAVAGWLTIPFVYHIGRRFGKDVALVGAGLLAVSPAHIWYSQEARMYSLLVLLMTASTWLAWQWWTDPSARTWPRTVLYGLVTMAGIYTHNFAVFAIAAQNLMALTLGWLPTRQHRWRIGARWIVGQLVWLAGFSLWVPTLFFQTTQHRMTWIPPISYAAVRNTWLYLLYGSSWQSRWQDVVGALVGLGLLALALWYAFSAHSRDETRTDLRWLNLWLWLQVLLVFLAARFLLIYQDKQMLILLPAVVLLLAVGLSRLRYRLVQGLLIVVLLAFTAGPLHQQYTGAQKQGWRELAAHVDSHAQPSDVVYFNPHAGKLTFDYYSLSDLPQVGYPPQYTLLRGGWVGSTATPNVISAQLDELAEKHPRVWLIDFVPGFWDPDDLIRAGLASRYNQVQVYDFHGVDLRLFSREKSP
jgi:4-amino-4-deoxy-L-arabinose transferase-like glycosyltransferase